MLHHLRCHRRHMDIITVLSKSTFLLLSCIYTTARGEYNCILDTRIPIGGLEDVVIIVHRKCLADYTVCTQVGKCFSRSISERPSEPLVQYVRKEMSRSQE